MTAPCTLQRITPHVYWFTPDSRTDRPSLGLIVGSARTLMVEAGASPAHVRLFFDALTAENVRRPSYAALTHWHWDHAFGAAALDGVPLFAYTETARKLEIQAGYDWSNEALDQRVLDGLEIAFCRDMIKAELPDRSSINIVVPDVRFSDSITLDLGDKTAEITHVGGEHSPDSSIIYVPHDKVLFLGDCHYPNIHATPNYYTAESIFPLLDKIIGYDAEFYVEGHGDGLMNRADMLNFAQNACAAYEAVEQHNGNRSVVLEALKPRNIDPDEMEWLVDAFIGGRARNPTL